MLWLFRVTCSRIRLANLLWWRGGDGVLMGTVGGRQWGLVSVPVQTMATCRPLVCSDLDSFWAASSIWWYQLLCQ